MDLVSISLTLCLKGHEALRREETKTMEVGETEEDVALTLIEVEQADGKYSVQVSNDAFVDDWYHRGPDLAWMSHYLYAMYVRVVPKSDGLRFQWSFAFVHHYKKYAGFVQVLEPSPRVPYMVGFTMPTRSADPATNALYHLCLMKPSRVCKGCCEDVAWLAGHVLSSVAGSQQGILFGYTKPAGQAQPSRGERRFTEAWKAWEALQLTRAERAWAKLKLERRVGVLDDVAPFREWYVPGCNRKTIVQSWLLPWLRGGFRHCYKGPWGQKRRTRSDINPIYSKAQFVKLHPTSVGVLPALPHVVAVCILRFAGNVKGEGNEDVVIADTLDAQDKAASSCRTDAQKTVVRTGTGVHVNQLFPEEFGASITAEVSWNMDLLAEARKRPRPNAVAVSNEDEDDDAGGAVVGKLLAAEGETPGGEAGDDYDVVVEQPYSEEKGLQYKPRLEIQDCDVLEIAHRLDGWRDGRGAASNVV